MEEKLILKLQWKKESGECQNKGEDSTSSENAVGMNVRCTSTIDFGLSGTMY
jgi:hypothetical protein